MKQPSPAVLPDWERLLAAERHLQHLLPEAVRVGGTAASIHAGHRLSLDGDHVLTDLRDRFDEVLRHRMWKIVQRVCLPYPYFWAVALKGLGEKVDLDATFPEDGG